VIIYSFWSAGMFNPIEEKAHAFSGYIRKTQTLMKIIEAVILKKCLLGFRVLFVVTYIPLYVPS